MSKIDSLCGAPNVQEATLYASPALYVFDLTRSYRSFCGALGIDYEAPVSKQCWVARSKAAYNNPNLGFISAQVNRREQLLVE